jgi:DNA-binding NarL/FixJ family response regulator
MPVIPANGHSSTAGHSADGAGPARAAEKPAPQSAITVFLVAENRLLRESLARIFESCSEFKMVGSNTGCLEALDAIAAAAPAVLLLGHDPAGLDAFRELRERLGEVKLVFFGMQEEEETFFAAVRAGAVGYVLKDASSADLLAAVRAAAEGEAACPPRLCLALFRYVAGQAQPLPNFRLRRQFGFTRREQQLLPLLAQGLTNKEIALALHLSEQTVKNHIHRMMRKAGACDRFAVVENCSVNKLFD